ncbi:MAG: hypothetical protein PsegKO_36420 [Pseudohongiellaceae bacterium]
MISQNPDCGFHGEMTRQEASMTAAEAFALAHSTIASALPTAEPTAIRAFLDSRHGRHFADDVMNARSEGQDLQAALTTAITRWQGWRIGKALNRSHGIPADLPYLTGFITHFEITEDAE